MYQSNGGRDESMRFRSKNQTGVSVYVKKKFSPKNGNEYWVTYLNSQYKDKATGEWVDKKELWTNELIEILRCGLQALRFLVAKGTIEMPDDLAGAMQTAPMAAGPAKRRAYPNPEQRYATDPYSEAEDPSPQPQLDPWDSQGIEEVD